MENKRGQGGSFGMSFGMIFSIILIVVFIGVAFIVISMFLDFGDQASVGLFYSDLQDDINEALREQSSESNFKIELPSKITHVCFANLSDRISNPGPEYSAIKNYEVYEANTFLIPPEYSQGMEWNEIQYINITKITEEKNPYCVEVRDGLRIKKGFYDKLVVVE